MRFSCGVPLYHPSTEQLKHIEIYAGLFDTVYIVDNTENGAGTSMRQYLDSINNVVVFATGENQGLSVAYNQMCRRAIQDGFDWLVIYDQDSQPSPFYINKLRDYVEKNVDSDVAVYGPVVCKEKGREPEDQRAVEVEVLISSGSFVNLQIYAQTPGFDEAFFIDKVDDDYCLMARQRGFRIIQVRSCFLYHRIGEWKKIFGKIVEQHSPLRMYYITRNTLMLYKKYGKSGLERLGWFVNRLRHTLLYDDSRYKKVKRMFLGAWDYKHGITGKKLF